jgi:hypothetical protein
MKKSVLIILMFVCFLIASGPMAALSAEKMDHTEHVGKKIHESTVQGYRLAYHLLDLPNREAHHLMVYIVDPAGIAVTKAKVGYLVTGPDKAKQKAMAMGMKNAFGADVDMTVPGTYSIKTKALAGGKKLLDQFAYEMK